MINKHPIVPTLQRGNAAGTAPAGFDAERHRRRSHGDRGNDEILIFFLIEMGLLDRSPQKQRL